ncbi:beta carbonic anhydrase 1 isoform X4 [Leptopilina boulardi]|uniref:beta carbonic anhydrase 1 isoform X4 n=1 Tax=Leptopilina boulardi TaxID=63433 RepID=UPI0021F5F7DD|nr:beta carbonic anhydrase 1 isoform X4 [Leptopilina boulardi]XP_051170440.1 beta carbonic anhydrase 1 isoform X4 [Leptopilina boulardi]
MDRILRGIMKYRKCHREGMVKQFQQVRDNPEPKAIFFTCMDSRMIPTRFTETNVGDMFVGTTLDLIISTFIRSTSQWFLQNNIFFNTSHLH